MVKSSFFLAVAFGIVGRVAAQSPQVAWGQCGGQGWTGPTTCVSGYICTYQNTWHSQCLPINLPTATTTSSWVMPTLIAGYDFIRAVEAPNFHKYLRSEIINTASDAVLGEPETAAQFYMVGGMLVQMQIAMGVRLYATVEPLLDTSVKKLKVTWSPRTAYYGEFVFNSADAVEWSHPDIARPQNDAFIICPDESGNKDLYVNLGQTPDGCTNVTIHAYTGPTAIA